jgi:hypothetical protein
MEVFPGGWLKELDVNQCPMRAAGWARMGHGFKGKRLARIFFA